MTDQESIAAAYADSVAHLFDVLHQAFIIAQTPNEKTVAENRFKHGLQIARETKTRALALL